MTTYNKRIIIVVYSVSIIIAWRTKYKICKSEHAVQAIITSVNKSLIL